jgi:hypothetical protein
MRTGLRYAAVLAAAFTVPAAVPAPIAATAQAGLCRRVVSIAPQRSGGEGVGGLTFTVFPGECGTPGEVGYIVTAGTATAGSDFTPVAGRLRWAEGDAGVRTITVPILQDALVETITEEFTVRLVDPDPGVRIAGSVGQGRILDDDGSGMAMVVDDDGCPYPTPNGYCPCPPSPFEYQPNEPNCTDPRLHLSAPQSSPVVVRWSTLDGTALAGIDYVPVSDRFVTIPAGRSAADLTVRLIARPKETSVRWFYVRIVATSAGVIADGIAVITLGSP